MAGQSQKKRVSTLRSAMLVQGAMGSLVFGVTIGYGRVAFAPEKAAKSPRYCCRS